MYFSWISYLHCIGIVNRSISLFGGCGGPEKGRLVSVKVHTCFTAIVAAGNLYIHWTEMLVEWLAQHMMEEPHEYSYQDTPSTISQTAYKMHDGIF